MVSLKLFRIGSFFGGSATARERLRPKVNGPRVDDRLIIWGYAIG